MTASPITSSMARPQRALSLLCLGVLALCSAAQAGITRDANGNMGYDSAAECDAAVQTGSAKFYQPFTDHPPLKRTGEADVKQQTIADLVNAKQAASSLGYDASAYSRGACDLGVGRSQGRDGVSRALIGKWIPFSPSMPINVYFDAQSQAVRASMQKCDNNFEKNLPRPVGVVARLASTECFATVQIPAKFETKTEQVVRVPATKRVEVIPATYKTVSEQVLVTPEVKRQFPVPATYKTVTEEVVVQPATTREEPVPGTFKMVSERVLAKAESKRIEVITATFKTVSEQVLVAPERKTLKVIPATYEDKEETVVDRPATTRVETIPATFKTETEQVLVRPESLRYEPIALPLKRVTEQVERTEAGKRLEAIAPTYKTVTERVLVKAASKRLVEVPATYETVTERIKVADSYKEWKRGRAWIGQAIDVRPLRGFVIGADGRTLDGVRVDAAAAPGTRGTVDRQIVQGNNTNLDDDVLCLVEVPEQFQTVSRQVVKTPASVREVEVPAEYSTITKTVLNTEAGVREIEVPATFQTVTTMEIDVDKLKAAGYKFDDRGDIIAAPSGQRVLRASAVSAAAGSGTGAGAGAGVSKGAVSGEEGYVVEFKIPAEYRTLTRTVMDKPASVRTVEVPGTTKVVTSRVIARAAFTEEVLTPAVYRTVTSQVVDTPASSREIVIPAEYKTVERRVVDTPPSTRKVPVPEVKQTVSRRVVGYASERARGSHASGVSHREPS
ncbi:MAG: hypothetical protein HC765_07745, partial [Brachymonas sp.]|nr:hypothetical protein [Brachymonas sp.]